MNYFHVVGIDRQMPHGQVRVASHHLLCEPTYIGDQGFRTPCPSNQ
jgi:hypothetical protein